MKILPSELIIEISSFLDFSFVIKNLSLVCKKLYFDLKDYTPTIFTNVQESIFQFIIKRQNYFKF